LLGIRNQLQKIVGLFIEKDNVSTDMGKSKII